VADENDTCLIFIAAHDVRFGRWLLLANPMTSFVLRLLVLPLALLSFTARPAIAQPATSPGILLLAHGGSKVWNASVGAIVADVNRERPTEVAFGMATRQEIQAAVDRLVARGVTEIVAVPLFVSSHSSVIRSTEYLLGLRADAPADLALFAKMHHGAGGHRHGDAAAPAVDGTRPIVSPVPIRMTGALGAHPIVADILIDRAAVASTDAAHEVVILVAHGPVPDDDNNRWLADLATLGARIKSVARYKGVEWQTVRDDAPEPIRGQAATELRDRVTRISSAGDRALIVPVLISFGGIEAGLRKRLDGLQYAMATQGLLPDPRLAEWVRTVARAVPVSASEPPRLFDSVTVSATLNPSSIKETPSTVAVIDAETIARRMVESTADLVKFEPGVYVETVANRVGLNGFNIRGIGGNRVMTQVDGVDTSEQFDFGPFNVHQFALDLDTLKSAEIVRSAGSALYGSDALGGVVSFFTKDPADYLGSRAFHAAAKIGFDGRSNEANVNGVLAGGRGRVTASLFASHATGHESSNHGTIETQDATRTALNPQDRQSAQALGKAVVRLGDGHQLKAAIELADHDIDTDAFSSRTPTVLDITSNDTMRRQRVSLDHTLANRGGLAQWSSSLFVQTSDTDQVVRELRVAGSTRIDRNGTLSYEQDSAGGSTQARKLFTTGRYGALATVGASYERHTFDMIRDRLDINTQTGAVVPAVGLILPTKYFPKSDVGETGAYAQAEMKIGRLTLVPGLRYDRFTVDADASDAVFLATQSPVPADFDASAVSTRLGAAVNVSTAVTVHAQYSGGFRAPPYSAINSGFTNLQGGYTSVPNADLDPETSDNFEVGVRSVVGRVSFGATVFSNHYDDFILQATRGVNPQTGLQEFQYQNVSKARIEGLELQGDARLTDRIRLRASYALIRGNDVSGDADVPLDSIAPDQGVVGIEYVAASGRWGSELSARAVRAQRDDVVGATLFAPASYATADATAWWSLPHRLTLRAGVLNLTNAKYFEWANVRGRATTDRTIDRYSSPGVSGQVAVSYGW
jgi:hemoglobin/transferrin/lactoferrin receptor protein